MVRSMRMNPIIETPINCIRANETAQELISRSVKSEVACTAEGCVVVAH